MGNVLCRHDILHGDNASSAAVGEKKIDAFRADQCYMWMLS